MKSFDQLLSYLKESTESSLTDKNGVHHHTMKHHDDMEMTHFLKSPEGAGHEFVGKDRYGKPHTADKRPVNNNADKVGVNKHNEDLFNRFQK